MRTVLADDSHTDFLCNGPAHDDFTVARIQGFYTFAGCCLRAVVDFFGRAAFPEDVGYLFFLDLQMCRKVSWRTEQKRLEFMEAEKRDEAPVGINVREFSADGR